MKLLANSRRGTTMLFLAGAAAVVFMLGFSMFMATTRGVQQSTNLRNRIQAQMAADAGVLYARRHPEALTSGPVEMAVGSGAFVITADEPTSGTRRVRVEGRMPANNPLVTIVRAVE